MGTQDGAVGGAFYIFPDPPVPDPAFSNIGPSLPQNAISGLVEVVLLAEGFTDAESVLFRDKCIAFTNWLRRVPWFDELGKTIRICSIGVSSNESGMDDFRGENDIHKATYFDSALGGWGVSDPNLITYNGGLASDLCNQFFPSWRSAVILVNSREGRANARAPLAVVNVRTENDDNGIAVDRTGARNEGWMNVTLHELGHSLFGLADEYNSWLGCGKDTDRDRVGWGFEPGEPNVTRESNLSNVKWNSFMPPAAPVALWAQCEDCPDYDNPFENIEELPNDSISLFEGAQYYHCGMFRPAFRCRMRSSGHQHFCQVCLSSIVEELSILLPATSAISVEPKSLRDLRACVGRDDSLLQHFRIGNLGNAGVNVRVEPDNAAIETTPTGVVFLAAGQFLDCTAKLSVQFSTSANSSNINIINDSTNASLLSIPVDVEVCNPRFSRTMRGLTTNEATGQNELNFGRITSGHTSFKKIRIINRRACCSDVLQATVSINNSPNTVLSIPPGQTNPINLEPAPRTGDQPEASVWISLSAIAALPLGNFSDSITITYANGSTDTIPVVAEVVSAIPIDVILAVDRSGSMSVETSSNGPTRMAAVIDAVDQFVHFIRDSDEIGLVRFNQNSRDPEDVLVPLDSAGQFGGNGAREAILSSLDPSDANLLLPLGGTSLGNGGLRAVSQLEGGSSDRRAIIMLTDGQGNVFPEAFAAVGTAMTRDPSQRFYIIALEVEEMSRELEQVTQLPARLDDDGNEIAPAAEILITGTVAAEREFILHKFYTQILADEIGHSFVLDPVYNLAPAQSIVIDIGFAEIDYSADIVACAHPTVKYLSLMLEAPTGEQYAFDINDGPDSSGTVRRVMGTTTSWKGFRCSFPVKPQQNHAGQWRLIMSNEHPDIAMRTTLLVTADSDLKLQGRLKQGAYSPGVPMDITLSPTLFDRPVELIEPVQVTVKKPNQTQEVVTLELNEFGVYHHRYRHTDSLGVYHFDTRVYAKSAQGMVISRERHMTGFIAIHKDEKGPVIKAPIFKPHKSWKPVPVGQLIKKTKEQPANKSKY